MVNAYNSMRTTTTVLRASPQDRLAFLQWRDAWTRIGWDRMEELDTDKVSR